MIRVRGGGGLGALGRSSIVCGSITATVADEVVALMRELRGDAAIDAIAKPAALGGEMLRDAPLRR